MIPFLALAAGVVDAFLVNRLLRCQHATKRVYTIHYVPHRSTTTFFAIEKEIVDWETEIIDHADGHVECLATPVYAERAPRAPIETFYPTQETIETTEPLDMDALLARDDVCSVTCEEIPTAKSSAAWVSDEEATASECEDSDDENAYVDAQHAVANALIDVRPSLFGLDFAVGAFLFPPFDV